MRQFLIIFSLLFSCSKTFSQLNLDVDKIPDKDSTTIFCWPTYMDSLLGLKPISESNNIIELRLYQIEMVGAKCKTICFNGKSWTGEIMTTLFYDKDSSKTLNTNLDFNRILDTLNQKGIFNLPDQKFLTLDGSVDDGSNYCISYKVGKKTRSYDFSNPDIYYTGYEKNKLVKELESYISIINIFDRLYRPK